MAQINVKVEGVEKTLANLKKWQIIKRQACEDVLKEIGFKVERDAKAGCPVWTGRLRASMSTNWAGSDLQRGKVDSKAKADDGVGRPAGEKGLTVVVGTNVKYAHMQEFGSWGPGPRPEKGEHIPMREHEPTPRPSGGFQMLTKAKIRHEAELQKRIGEVLKKD